MKRSSFTEQCLPPSYRLLWVRQLASSLNSHVEADTRKGAPNFGVMQSQISSELFRCVLYYNGVWVVLVNRRTAAQLSLDILSTIQSWALFKCHLNSILSTSLLLISFCLDCAWVYLLGRYILSILSGFRLSSAGAADSERFACLFGDALVILPRPAAGIVLACRKQHTK